MRDGNAEFRAIIAALPVDSVDQGTYVMTYGPDDVVERGKYLNVWKS